MCMVWQVLNFPLNGGPMMPWSESTAMRPVSTFLASLSMSVGSTWLTCFPPKSPLARACLPRPSLALADPAAEMLCPLSMPLPMCAFCNPLTLRLRHAPDSVDNTKYALRTDGLRVMALLAAMLWMLGLLACAAWVGWSFTRENFKVLWPISVRTPRVGGMHMVG